jgi:hypothetical protein
MRLLIPYLDFDDLLARPRGSSLATDALTLAVMSLSASHLSHLHHSSHVHGQATGTDSAAVAASALREEQYRDASAGMARASLALVRSALDLAKLKTFDGNVGGADQVEEMSRLLSACALAPLTDCVSGGNSYGASLNLAKEIVVHFGGARQMLSTVAAAIPPTKASPRAATSRRRLRLLRSSLEELLSWDLVTSLATGTAPTHYASTPPVDPSDGNGSHEGDRLQDWLFTFAPASGSRCTDDVDWETMEAIWGSTRAVADLFGRVRNARRVGRLLEPRLTIQSPSPGQHALRYSSVGGSEAVLLGSAHDSRQPATRRDWRPQDRYPAQVSRAGADGLPAIRGSISIRGRGSDGLRPARQVREARPARERRWSRRRASGQQAVLRRPALVSDV